MPSNVLLNPTKQKWDVITDEKRRGPVKFNSTYGQHSPVSPVDAQPLLFSHDDDEDSEYDSEMDDFIDDGDANVDVSSAIQSIFGYDKSR